MVYSQELKLLRHLVGYKKALKHFVGK